MHSKTKIIIPTICIIVLLVVGFNISKITTSLANFLDPTPKIVIEKGNAYTKKEGFLLVKNSETYIPYSQKDLMDIIYGTLNNGWVTFTFYCPKEYTNCFNDLKEITNDSIYLTHINNYVHPYNSIKGMDILKSETGEVTLKPKYVYTLDERDDIDKETNLVIKQIITDDMETYDKIRTIHDYIINNVRYDVQRNDTGTSPYQSNSAFGPLFQGYATCDGYADLLAIYLNKLGIKNYRIAKIDNSDDPGHVWNAVFLNNQWLHIDLTWDDPVASNGEDILRHTYFLITNEELALADQGKEEITSHHFDPNIYLEFKAKN